jgi:hypothetical protein
MPPVSRSDISRCATYRTCARQRDNALQLATQRVFRSLAEVGERGRLTRRALPFAQLVAETGLPNADLKEVVDAYREPGHSFLVPLWPRLVEERTVIDISHEALIRHWDKLGGRDAGRGWLEEEQADADAWRRLYSRVQAFTKGSPRLLDSDDIEEFTVLLNKGEPPLAWLQRYIPQHQGLDAAEIPELDSGSLVNRTNELVRMSQERQQQAKLIEAIGRNVDPDSPLYSTLSNLEPHDLEKGPVRGEAPSKGARPEESYASLWEAAMAAKARSNFATAKAILREIYDAQRGSAGSAQAGAPQPRVIQELVLATYKAKQPNETAALDEALQLLAPLQPDVSNDSETVGLAGAIEKRLFDQGRGADHLDHAIRHYWRGYYLRDDWYNGINLSYLLTLRADQAPEASDNERVADFVWANRIRREVLALCERDLQAIRDRNKQLAQPDGLGADQRVGDLEQEFWCLGTKAEAHFGLGDMQASETARAEAAALNPAAWMMETLNSQLERLGRLLSNRKYLLSGGV